ncbi:PDDEXK family nuclease [Acaryochloris marina]|nr:Uma2 family endonuclease [Acaryochloris marina]
MDALVVSVPPSTQLTDRQFYDLCLANPDLKIERTAQGELIFMPPTGGETGKRNATLDLLQYSFDDVVLLFAIPQVVKDSS